MSMGMMGSKIKVLNSADKNLIRGEDLVFARFRAILAG